MKLRYILHLIFFLLQYVSFAQFENKQLDIVDVLNYEFHITINDTTNNIKAIAIDKFTLLQNVDSVYFNLINKEKASYGMTVTSVKNAQGKTVLFNHMDNKLIVYDNWQKHDTVQLKINYSGIPKDGLYIKTNKYGKRTFFGDNWPTRARYWLPVIDHLSDKATVSFIVTAPSHYKLIASGKFIKKEILSPNENRYHYRSTIALPTKVMVFGAADFKIKNFEDVAGIPVSSWVFEDAPEGGLDDYQSAVSVLKYYTEIVGQFPYEKLANVQSKTRFGGMENAGNIFYMEESVDGNKKVETLIAHEMAHQWFGDSVTEKQWKDIWLSEGFATYLTDLYLENHYEKQRMRESLKKERDKAIRYSHTSKVQPIVYDENENLFKLLNRNSYEKGAWVLHMLRVKVGDADFFTILKTFYNKYKNLNASTDDFIGIAESVSKIDLKDFFEQWLYRKTIPKIKLEWEYSNGKITIHTTQIGDVYTLNLPISISDGSTNKIYKLPLDTATNTFIYKIRLNADNIKVLLDPKVQVLFENQCL